MLSKQPCRVFFSNCKLYGQVSVFQNYPSGHKKRGEKYTSKGELVLSTLEVSN